MTQNIWQITNLFWLAPCGSVFALIVAYIFYKEMLKKDEGSKTMKAIALYVRQGAMAYIKQQYKVVTVFFGIAFLFFIFLAFGLHVQSGWVPIAFLTGGFFSGLSGFIGLKTATYASARTAQAAKKSLNGALQIALRSGAVMGLMVVGLGLLYISLWYIFLRMFLHIPLFDVTIIMLSFGIGASTQALFARVGGGIFTKAADVGADLVGKVEAGIPEDDPRNSAVIADNVGDNVGDVAGMGADLYESYCGSILATSALGSAAMAQFSGQTTEEIVTLFVIAPMIIAGIGTFFSIFGILFIRIKENASQKELISSLGRGINLSSLLILFGSGIVSYLLFKPILGASLFGGWIGIWAAIISGLLAGIIIGKSAEYYTSPDFMPTKNIAQNSKTGPATVIIAGIGTGMLSTLIPVILVVITIILSYIFSGGTANPYNGLYGIGLASVGMLSTLGLTLATDAYGPIADNAGGNAEMSKLPENVRQRTDALDALGNTTAATGKGFAIGSAALTALVLIAAYIEEVRISLIRIGITVLQIDDKYVTTSSASMDNLMQYYSLHFLNPNLIAGAFIGAMLPFVFSALTMTAVGKVAQEMVLEVRRQFKEIKGIMTGRGKPDYAACVTIATVGAQKQMILPSLTALLSPIIVGLIFGVAGVVGLLVGSLISGFSLAIFMANAGGAWDNAKKYIEEGNLGGKGSDCHKASIIGDTVGDPFKDTSGPSLNILIKLMSMVAVVTAGITVSFNLLGK